VQRASRQGFRRLPADLGKADFAKLASEDVDIVWHPAVEAMYPEGFATRLIDNIAV
jgi:pantothenate synthetase